MENNLNYKMYQYFFSHKNPMVKKVNVYLYNLYNPALLPNNEIKYNKLNGDGDVIYPDYINKYIIPEIRKGETSGELINLLNEINDKFNENNDVIIDETIKDLRKLDKKTDEIMEMFNTIKKNFNDSFNEADNKLRKIDAEIDSKNNEIKNIINLVKDIDFNKAIEKIINDDGILKDLVTEKENLKKKLHILEKEKNTKEIEKRNYIENLISKSTINNKSIKTNIEAKKKQVVFKSKNGRNISLEKKILDLNTSIKDLESNIIKNKQDLNIDREKFKKYKTT